jgi:hypothetical protein
MHERQLQLIARRAGAALVTALFAAAPISAAAAERKVAALPVAVEGEMPEHVRADIQSRILKELKHGDAEVIGPASLPDVAQDCATAECVREVAEAVEANYVLRSNVTIDGADYEIELIVLSGNTGDVVASAGDACDTCGAEEVASVAVDAATSIRRKLDSQASEPPKLVVNSQPAGAIVTLDGETLGTTPLDVEVPVGEHDVEVTKDGFVKQRQRMMFVDGVRESLSVSLSTTPTDGPVDGSTAGKGLRVGGWAAVAVGLAAVGTGVGFFASNGREDTSQCSGENVDADGDCKFRWDTTPGAIGFTVAGGVALVASAILLGLGYKKKKDARSAQLEPAPSGLRVRF